MAFDPSTVKPGSGFDPSKVQTSQDAPSDPPDDDDGKGQAEAFEQGAIFDPLEAIGQMLPPRVSSAIGSVIPEGVKRYAAESAAGAADHPVYRWAGNVAPWLLVPGAGESVLGDVALGVGSSVLQPTDPDAPDFWRQKGIQAVLGGATGGSLGAVARRAAARAAAQKAADAAAQFAAQTPERATMSMYQRIANEAGDPSIVPSAITPQTSVAVRNKVGAKLTSIYQQMKFNPDSRWISATLGVRDQIGGALVNPEMRARWDRVFSSEAFKPALLADPKNPIAPVSGEKLNQLVSDLSAQANQFGLEAQRGGAYADQWRQMANGLRQIRQNIVAQIDAANPALGAQRRAADRAYQLSDLMMRATSATKGGVAEPKDIIGAFQQKVGKVMYAKPQFGAVKSMLERERQAYAAKPQPPSAVNQLFHALRHHAAREAAAAVGLPRAVGSAVHAAGFLPRVPAFTGQTPSAGISASPVPSVISSILPGGPDGQGR